MECNKCGSPIGEGCNVCTNCGEPINQENLMKPKKKHKGLIIALSTIVIVIGIAAASIAIFLPGFFGPKDLGIKVSPESYQSAMAKLHFSDSSVSDKLKGVPVNTKLTSEELSSLLTYYNPDFKAFKNAQIRINDDNSYEFSASVSKDYFMDKVLRGQYSEEDLKNEVPVIGILPESVNLYMKLQGEVAENKLSGFDVENVNVMGISLPESVVDLDGTVASITSNVNHALEKASKESDVDVKSIKAENGQLAVEGNIPSNLLSDVLK